MKKVILMLLYVLSVYFINPLCLNAQNFSWAQIFTIANSNADGAACRAADDSNNIYTIVFFTGTIDVDPSNNIYNLTSIGAKNFCVLKEDAAGNFIWAKPFYCKYTNATGFPSFPDLTVDKEGNIYICGEVRDTADFDPGVGTNYMGGTPSNSSSGGTNGSLFIVKLDITGDFVWSKFINGTNDSSAITNRGRRGIKCIDTNLYIFGYYAGTIDADPGINIVTHSTTVGAAIIVKLDTAGNFCWAKDFKGAISSMSFDIDSFSNLYLAGGFSGTIDFDPGPGVTNMTPAGKDINIFILKLDSLGQLKWVNQLGSNYDDQAQDIAVDRWGNVFVTGYFRGTVDFDPGPGVTNLSSISFPSHSIFTLKLHSNGDFVWAQPSGNAGFSTDGRMIITDTSGNVYVSSFMYPTQKYDSSGNLLWKLSSAGVGGVITIDKANAIYLSGAVSTLNQFDIDPGPGVYMIPGGGGIVGFILKLCQEPLVPFTLSADTVCTGDSLYLSIAPIAGATYYYWLRNDTLRAGSVSNNSPGLSGGGFYQVVAYGNDCPIASQKIFVQELPKKLPRISLSAPSPVPAGQTVTVSALILGYSGSYSIDWYSNNTYLATTQTNTYNLVKQPHNELLHAWLHPVTKCYDSAISLPIWVTTTVTSATTVNANTTPSVYPNPFSQELTFSGLVSGDRIWVMDITGRVLYREDAEHETLKMDTQELAVGYYIIKLYSRDGHLKGNFPLVKQ